MALKQEIDYDQFGMRKSAEEEAEKKRQMWLDEDIEIKVKDCSDGKPPGDTLLFIKRRDLIDLINGSGALDDIRNSCRRSDLQDMRF